MGRVGANSAVLSSNSDNWGTPIDLFEKLDRKWAFSLDPCANPARLLKPASEMYPIVYPGEDGLTYDWSSHTVFCNPPYSGIAEWVKKAHENKDRARIVMLIPARTDTRYWHLYIQNYALAVHFLKGRLKFYRADGGAATSAPFPSALVYF